MQLFAPENRSQGEAREVEDRSKGCSGKDLHTSRAFDVQAIILAGQVLLCRTRKEAALDLHSPFSTSHSQPIRLADRSFASPFLTFPTLCLF